MSTSLDTSRVFSTLLYERLRQLEGSIPAQLDGVIQLEVRRGSKPAAFRYLEIRRGRVQQGEGTLDRFDAWVTASEDDLHALMFAADGASTPALTVSGRADMVTSLFAFMRAAEAPKSVIALMGDRS